MSTAIQTPQRYLGTFGEFEQLATGRDLEWLQTMRREAFSRFCEKGFPTTRDEDWRFTDVSAIANTEFRVAQHGRRDVSPALWRMEGAGCQLVFVDGHFAQEMSVMPQEQKGVTILSLGNALRTHAELVQRHLGQYLNQERDTFAAMNTAFAEDGAFVHVERGVVVDKPICLLFMSTRDWQPMMSHPRSLILVDEGSEASVVEEYVSVGNGTTFCNSVTEVLAGESAVFSHYRIEREQGGSRVISTLRIQQGRSANVASHAVLLGGALVRNNVHPVLAGEGGECLINGLFLGSASEHLDNYMLVEHASAHCGSRQFYNGILDDRAHGVFHGRIIVHKDAQKTDAKQTNRNLLLSDDAQIDTKPQLQIHADDVKCTHGATIGQIDEDALFYLRSRGVAEREARNLLLLAFAGECLDRMKDGAERRHVEKLVNEHVLRMANTLRPELVR